MKGFTKEEKFLNELGGKSFLRFWSWPNLFRNQGGSKGDGKEICDLTIVFGDDILLFSDKKIKFSINEDVSVSWSRWARKAISDSVKQIKGARRWFVKYPNRVFIDSKCSLRIPIDIPTKENVKFHNIVVCHGIEDILKSFNDESSFVFDNSIKGEQHWNKDDCKPFCVGQIFEEGFVHIFNESTIELVLKEFDTTKDFIYYLKKREGLLNSDKNVRVKSESDIIQLYYEGYNEEVDDRSILPDVFKDAESVIIDKGGIHELYSNPSYVAKKNEDSVSYFWDDLIESFSYHILNGSAEYRSWDYPNEIEPSIRYMAETGRFERRILSTSFIEFYYKALPGQRGTRLCLDPFNKNNAYLFLQVPFFESFSTHEKYRELRRNMLQDYCIINKLYNKKIENIIGIAYKTRDEDSELSRGFFNEGQDFVFMDVKEWNDFDEAEAENLRDQYLKNRLLAKREISMENISEFPENRNVFRRKIDFKGKDRNLPCICGSGKKIKRCCGRQI